MYEDGLNLYKKELHYDWEMYSEVSQIEEVEWMNIITERRENGRIELCSIFLQNVQVEQNSHTQPFNKVIMEAIQRGKVVAVAVADPSLKDSKILDYQKITS